MHISFSDFSNVIRPYKRETVHGSHIRADITAVTQGLYECRNNKSIAAEATITFNTITEEISSKKYKLMIQILITLLTCRDFIHNQEDELVYSI